MKYKANFTCGIKIVKNTEIEQLLSTASLKELTQLMPKNVDLENNPDLMGIVLNAAVGGLANRNHDAITNKTMVKIARNFINKPCDFNHKRDKILGVIVNAGFSEFGTNKILTAEEAENSIEPVNLSLALLLWTSILSDNYLKLLEASADENSPDYGAISASWELWYDEFDIGVSEDGTIAKASIYTGDEAKKLESSLPSRMGKGYLDAKMVFKILKHDENNIVLPAGIGLVENPAAHVEGLDIVTAEFKNNKENKEEKPEDEETKKHEDSPGDKKEDETEQKTRKCPDCEEENEDDEKEEMTCKKCGKTSNNKNKSVTNTKEQSNSNKMTKLSTLKDITQDNLKDLSIANLNELVENRLREANVAYEADVNKHKNDVEALNKEKESLKASLETAKTEIETNKSELNTVKEQLVKLVEANTAREVQTKFDERFNVIASKFKLSDAQKSAVANRIKTIKTDEDFVAYASELELFYKPEVTVAEPVETPEEKTKKEKELAEAAVRTGLENAEKDKLKLPNTTSGNEDFAARASKAFGREGIELVINSKKKV